MKNSTYTQVYTINLYLGKIIIKKQRRSNIVRRDEPITILQLLMQSMHSIIYGFSMLNMNMNFVFGNGILALKPSKRVILPYT